MSNNTEFNRNYNITIPFLGENINIGIFAHTKSPDMKIDVDHDFESKNVHGVKIMRYSNIATSDFCDIFVKLNNYEHDKLSIVNQFSGIKEKYKHLNELHYIFNEDIKFSKHHFSTEHATFDQFMIFCFGFNVLPEEYIFMIAERQCILTNIKKKIVRTTAIQIANSKSIDYLKTYNR